jgi:UDP-glucose 4-epimerase
MMRVLVTGGHGYIGGRLTQNLANDPAFHVTSAGRRPRAAPAGVTAAVVDWSDTASLGALCRGQEAVVHLAGMNEHDCEKDPESALRANGLATLMLLRAAVGAGVSRFVYVSTSKVFGTSPTGVIDETSLPHPSNHYAITHRVAEDYVLAANKGRALQGVVLRLSNGLGAPTDPNVNAWTLIANDLCRQAAVNQRVVLKSSGLAWRNFVAMADVVSALRHVLMISAETVGDGLFHVGGPESLRIWDLAQRIGGRAELMLHHPVAIERASPAGAEQHLVLNWRIDKLMAIGWAPSASLDREIDDTLHVCRDAFVPA